MIKSFDKHFDVAQEILDLTDKELKNLINILNLRIKLCIRNMMLPRVSQNILTI